MRLNLKSVEERVRPLAGKGAYDREFIFDLLAAYGRTGSNITRLRNGSLNVAADPTNEVAQKGVVYFKHTNEDLYGVIDDLKRSPHVVRYSTRFVIVTDFDELLAVDTKTGETLATPIAEIDKHFAFFLPWAGMEKAQYVGEKHADVKAAEKMAKLFDEIVAFNKDSHPDRDYWHGLNVFFTRLLFCYFAEDTEIFAKSQFTDAIGSYTQTDGSDLHTFLTDLFAALDSDDKSGMPSHFAAFPYVNGRLFQDSAEKPYVIPRFNKKARDLLLESGRLLWDEINPDIFGSMFQAVITPGQRADLGMHYTSVPNIMKTIDPLFLDALKQELNSGFDSEKKLNDLLKRISNIKVFDPACGSGNFLVIAYKELRKLEHAILERQQELKKSGQRELLGSRINVEHFFGIEIDDFAVEVAILSLWIAKHQMNIEFKQKFGIDLPLIPLKEAGKIVEGNATRVDWNDVCSNNGTDEIYLISNPPYLGAKLQTAEQKTDFENVFQGESYSKNLDYIALWFVKGARYITDTRAELAFVTTNSVSQGEHVGLMFPKLFSLGLEIGFAYTSFKWENNAKYNAGVTVAVISLRKVQTKPKFIRTDGVRIETKHINGYLADGPEIYIHTSHKSLSALPPMSFGNMPLDGGHLILSDHEYNEILASRPEASRFIRKLYGAREYIHGSFRWCLWIDDEDLEDALLVPKIRDHVENTRGFRLASRDSGTRKKANVAHQFREHKPAHDFTLIVPRHSSERREYIPIGYPGGGTIISDSANVVYEAKPFVFGLLTSRMHMVWVRAVAGQLETRIRYSATLVYNNFSVPVLNDRSKKEIEDKVFAVLDSREYHSENTLATLYDPDLMPDDLRLAHQSLDEVVDRIYRKKPFESDEERLSHLFSQYKSMAAAAESKLA